jgi:hypothetical protein
METENKTIDPTCEACAYIALDIPYIYTVDMVLCGDCEAYYGVADYLEGNK